MYQRGNELSRKPANEPTNYKKEKPDQLWFVLGAFAITEGALKWD
jgi:hypothetical protein